MVPDTTVDSRTTRSCQWIRYLIESTQLLGDYNNVYIIATLEPTLSASVDEGEELQVCVSLDPSATGNTVVTVATSVETATGGNVQ